MNAIEGILFDKDGTLFDFHATWSVWTRRFLQGEAKGDAELLARMAEAFGYDLEADTFFPHSTIIAGTPESLADILAQFHGPENRQQEMDRMNKLAGEAPQAEAVPLVPYLADLQARGMKLGVATNDGEVPAIAHLKAARILEAFDFVVGYDSGFGGKPAPGQLHAFCEATGLAPENCAMVGDSLHDLHAGKSAGMLRIGVLTGVAKADDLAPHADVVLADIGEIPAWLDSRG